MKDLLWRSQKKLSKKTQKQRFFTSSCLHLPSNEAYMISSHEWIIAPFFSRPNFFQRENLWQKRFCLVYFWLLHFWLTWVNNSSFFSRPNFFERGRDFVTEKIALIPWESFYAQLSKSAIIDDKMAQNNFKLEPAAP